MAVARDHQHVSSDIMQVDAVHTPISPSGGGVSVDNGTDPPAPVTTIVAPGAVVADGSADLSDVLQMRVLGPFRVAYDTAGIATSPGLLLASLPAGTSIVRAWAIVMEQWAADASVIMRLRLAINGAHTTNVTNYLSLDAYSPDEVFSDAEPVFDTDPKSLVGIVHMNGEFRCFVSGTNRTAGEADIYAIIATPAS